MPAEVPIIYTAQYGNARLAWTERLLSLGISLGCLAVLVTAAQLTPHPAGMGTHRDLGLYACTFVDRTGLPCPSCGMTTSFTWFAHGNLLASFYVQPAGLALAILATLVFWTGLYIAITGKPVHRLLKRFPPIVYLSVLFGIGIFGWAWKIFLYVKGMDGWG